MKLYKNNILNIEIKYELNYKKKDINNKLLIIKIK